jgi:hypothetical protein
MIDRAAVWAPRLLCCTIRPLQRLVRQPTEAPVAAHRGFLICKARWQSGHAAACKAVYAGSIPTLASNRHSANLAFSRRFCSNVPFHCGCARASNALEKARSPSSGWQKPPDYGQQSVSGER